VPKRYSWSWRTVALIFFMAIMAVFALFPLYALFLASLKPSQELLRYGLNVRWDMELMSFKNYISIFSGVGAAKSYFFWYGNSLVITLIYTLLCLFLSSMVGYGLAIYQFKGKSIIFIMVLALMMVPLEIILLPLYKLVVGLKLMDSMWGVILPFVVSPLPIFFFRQYAAGLPRDFLDAGRIDGCTEFGIYLRIMTPLMAPAFGAMAILQAMGQWNNFLWPLIVLKSSEKLTLPIGLASLLTPYGNNYDVLIAGSVLAILPILILFVFFQRYFVSGLTVGGVKG
jgi:arabinosaccharide transport system permease protein